MSDNNSEVPAGVDRRTILRAVGTNTVAAGLLAGVAGADSNKSSMNITKAEKSERRHLIGKARQSKDFQRLRKELVSERGFTAPGRNVNVFQREQNEDLFYVVSFPLEHPTRDDIQNADMCVVLNSDESVRTVSGSIGSATSDGAVLTQLESFTVTEDSVEVQSKQITKEALKIEEGVTGQSHEYCSGCKELYELTCKYGCYIGWSSLCVLFTGGLGLVWCEGAVAAVCDFIDDNSCEPTAEVACEIIGYC